ncbi:hypothetical protein DEI82_11190 [Curtobacterium sp. MCBD17_019]|nr:hypothetical protein DEI82_11190 [Curtobacterium sp. MCBD17_019]
MESRSVRLDSSSTTRMRNGEPSARVRRGAAEGWEMVTSSEYLDSPMSSLRRTGGPPVDAMASASPTSVGRRRSRSSVRTVAGCSTRPPRRPRTTRPTRPRRTDMVSFDHREPGTDPASWTTFLAERTTERLDLDGIASVVVLAPHPDDETLAAGGLLATAAELGLPARVLLATRGERSHPDSPTTTPERLAALRESEFATALQVLQPDIRATRVRLPDGELREHRSTLRDALDHVLAGMPTPTLLAAPWTGDGDRDHRAAGEVAEEAAAAHDGVTLVEYPIWMWHWDDPASASGPWDRVTALPVPPALRERKFIALTMYASQVGALSDAPGDEAIVDLRHLEHFTRAEEVFFRIAATERPSIEEPGTTAALAEEEPGTTAAPAEEEPGTTAAPAEEDPRTTPAPGGGEAGPADQPSPDGSGSRTRASSEAHSARRPDGRDFEHEWYERRKRAVTMAALPRERWRSALEIGCATGFLTRELTERTDAVLGVDMARASLEQARRTAPRATFLRMTVPQEWPDGRFDLVVLSEVGHDLSAADLGTTVERVFRSLDPDGVLVACHWRHPIGDAGLDGDAVHARLRARWPRSPLVHHEEDDFVLDVFPGPAVPSVAQASGLVR